MVHSVLLGYPAVGFKRAKIETSSYAHKQQLPLAGVRGPDWYAGLSHFQWLVPIAKVS